MFFLDVLMYKLFCILFPEEKPTQYSSEDNANWIILEDLDQGEELHSSEKTDPMLNGDYTDGPDWDC